MLPQVIQTIVSILATKMSLDMFVFINSVWFLLFIDHDIDYDLMSLKLSQTYLHSNLMKLWINYLQFFKSNLCLTFALQAKV